MKAIKNLFILGLIGSVVGVVIVAGTIFYFSMSLPSVDGLADYKPSIPSRIYSKDGVVLAEVGKERRDVVQFNDIPKRVVSAFLAAEDDNFYNHSGVDYTGVLRAFVANIKAGRVVQGGSTITQQVAKSLLLSSERSISRKIKDFLLARKIEQKYSKEDILFLYLNQVYLGGGYYGVKSAFRGYFGKELDEATAAESAMVAGLLVAPSRYSPYTRPKYAKIRQGYVLKRMYQTSKISKDEYQEALNEKIKYRLRRLTDFKAGYFTDWVRQRVIAVVGEERFLNDGFEVQTTLDYELQQAAEREVQAGVKAIDKRQGFKGPIRKIDVKEIEAFELKQRRDFYKEESNYFSLKEDHSKEYELEVQENELNDIYQSRGNLKDKRKLSLLGGNLKEDRLLKVLKKDESYEAVVLKSDDRSKTIYISIGALTGVIPYKNFKWAHPRNISSDRVNWSYASRPSQVVKKGDIVLVKVKGLSSQIKDLVSKDYLARLKKLKSFKDISKERYLLCELDQQADSQAALVSLSPRSGEIVSFVGGADFKKSQFNRAVQSLRQPGSAFKPILFAAALENGFTPATTILDSPEALGGVDNSLSWKPRNYDGKFKGKMTFRESLEVSRNIPTIKIANKIGVSAITDFVERIGFNVELEKDLSLALGSFGVNLVDLVATYGIFPNGGKFIYPISILSVKDREGKEYIIDEVRPSPMIEYTKRKLELHQERLKANPDYQSEEKEKENKFHESLGGNQIYDSRLAYIMTNLLKGVIHYGTGRKARSVSPFIGGKTGTTSSYVDAWFVGFSSKLVTGVWAGFDDNTTLGYAESGGRSSLPIWRNYMKVAKAKYGEADFKIPRGIVNVRIDKKTGKLANFGDPNLFLESFVQGTEPGAEPEKTEEANEEESQDDSNSILEEDDYYNNQ